MNCVIWLASVLQPRLTLSVHHFQQPTAESSQRDSCPCHVKSASRVSKFGAYFPSPVNKALISRSSAPTLAWKLNGTSFWSRQISDLSPAFRHIQHPFYDNWPSRPQKRRSSTGLNILMSLASSMDLSPSDLPVQYPPSTYGPVPVAPHPTLSIPDTHQPSSTWVPESATTAPGLWPIGCFHLFRPRSKWWKLGD